MWFNKKKLEDKPVVNPYETGVGCYSNAYLTEGTEVLAECETKDTLVPVLHRVKLPANLLIRVPVNIVRQTIAEHNRQSKVKKDEETSAE